MLFNTALAAASLIVSVITIATVVYNSATRLAKIEVKVDTLWGFLMRRGIAEALNNELATMESPLHFTPAVLATLYPLRDALKALAAKNPADSQMELAFKIEREFGINLLMDFCLPLHVNSGACVLAALEIATGEGIDPIEELV